MTWKIVLVIIFIVVAVKWIRRDRLSNPVNQVKKARVDFFKNQAK